MKDFQKFSFISYGSKIRLYVLCFVVVFLANSVEANAQWTESEQLFAGQSGSSFGNALSMEGSRVIVGANNDDEVALNSGAAFIYRFDLSLNEWVEEAKLKASDASTFDRFGNAVALSGKRALVGAHYDDDGGINSGAAYVFVFNDMTGEWEEEAKLTPEVSSENFGRSVSLHGNVALIGAHLDDENGIESGAAYIFEYNEISGKWEERAKLTPAGAGSADWFGWSVSLSHDRALISAGNNTQSAYIFEYDEGTGRWNEKNKIVGSDTESGDSFGASVALNDRRAIVGASSDDYGRGSSGSVYVFVHNEISDSWIEESKLIVRDAVEGQSFGHTVSIHEETIAVGAHRDGNGVLALSGSAYIFRLNDSRSQWIEEQKLKASNTSGNDFFGIAVAVSKNKVLVGATSATPGGNAYVFEKNSNKASRKSFEHRNFTNDSSVSELKSIADGRLLGPEKLPNIFILEDNYPNPFDIETVIRFTIPEAVHIQLNVYDALGRKIEQLASGIFEEGKHEIRFDAQGLPRGIYFYRLETQLGSHTQSMLLTN